MGYARRRDTILLHGSAKSRLLNDLAKGTDVCITVTLLDGLVLARSTFHHSMNYRSVVVFGRSSVIEDEQTDVWLDVERLKLGDRWMEEFERTLAESHSRPVRRPPAGRETGRSHNESTPFFRFTNIEAWENSEPAFGVGQRGAGSSQASGEEVQL